MVVGAVGDDVPARGFGAAQVSGGGTGWGDALLRRRWMAGGASLMWDVGVEWVSLRVGGESGRGRGCNGWTEKLVVEV